MHARTTLTSALVVVVLGLAGCASKDDASDDATGDPGSTPSGTPTSSATTEPTDHGQVIDITIEGDTVRPNGKKVEVSANEPVTLHVTSDQPGDLHLHSTPEQEISFEAGQSTHSVTFDRPGVVEVESHQLEKVIVQLEVR